MKKIIYTFLMLAFLVSCNEDNGVEVNNFNGDDVTYFTAESASSYFVTPTAEPMAIQIGSTTTSSSDRTYTIQIDESSTAVEGQQFDFVGGNSVTIPAGEYFGEILVQGNYEFTDAEGQTLVITLTGDDTMVGSSYSLLIVQQCVSDLAGMYSVTTTYGYHDFLPSFNPNTMDTEVVEVADGVYSIGDFSGGLYSVGPYSTAYGTGPSSFTVEFSENCGVIDWAGQSDPWGACVPLVGGVNSVDINTGIITISWYCEGYGENGVSVYTPL